MSAIVADSERFPNISKTHLRFLHFSHFLSNHDAHPSFQGADLVHHPALEPPHLPPGPLLGLVHDVPRLPHHIMGASVPMMRFVPLVSPRGFPQQGPHEHVNQGGFVGRPPVLFLVYLFGGLQKEKGHGGEPEGMADPSLRRRAGTFAPLLPLLRGVGVLAVGVQHAFEDGELGDEHDAGASEEFFGVDAGAVVGVGDDGDEDVEEDDSGEDGEGEEEELGGFVVVEAVVELSQRDVVGGVKVLNEGSFAEGIGFLLALFFIRVSEHGVKHL
mmetsp:Transcript_32227/g.74204  ORF Transcript_32227/g.74204 Transcript_32227/m.74204 type:complete len:272 (-) Transcript_32227:2529-3344(-)